jgi:hypothetical protein
MSDSNLLLLLQLIYAGADVNALLRRGLQFSQIANLIAEATEKGLITEGEFGLTLTAIGIEEMQSKRGGNQQGDDGGWISPLDEYRIEKLSEDDIYLPPWDVVLFQLGQDH